ncbi:MAG: TrmH family RNA methyltransferase [Flavobacteriia bacterium]|nr:TrmH family RNA methyltransferase [Flavobacteriia bacterium]
MKMTNKPPVLNDFIYHCFQSLLTPHKAQLFDLVATQRTRHISIVLEDLFQEEDKNKYTLQRKVARGAGQWIDLHRFTERGKASQDAILHLKQAGYKIVATSPHSDAYTPDTLPISEPIALCFGTERLGLSPYILDSADYHVKIPMYGFTESFNLSVSVALVLQTLKKRLNDSEIHWSLSREEQIALKIAWSKRMLNGGELLEKQFKNAYFEKEF